MSTDVKSTSVFEETARCEKQSQPERQLRLDRHGLPMVPQPTSSADDPLNWNVWFRIALVMLVSGLGFIAQGAPSNAAASYRALTKSGSGERNGQLELQHHRR